MAGSGSKWLMGCGIGCGVLILISILLVGVGYFFIRDTVEGFKEAESSSEYLESRFGDVDDFTPEPDGVIDEDRVLTFVAVREAMEASADDVEDALYSIKDEVEDMEGAAEGKFWRILGIIRKGMGAIPQLAQFYKERNVALADEGMGLGEYYYMYVLIYYGWLDKSPDDGPDFQLMGDDNNGFRWTDDDEERGRYEEDVREERLYRMTRKARRMVMPMMRRQLEEAYDASHLDEAWLESLEDEVDRMRDDRDRLPWEDSMPDRMLDVLEHFRSKLERLYNPQLNPLELGPDSD